MRGSPSPGSPRLLRLGLTAVLLVGVVLLGLPAPAATAAGMAPGGSLAEATPPPREFAAGYSLLLAPLPAPTATPTLQQLEQALDAAWNAQDWEEVLRLIEQIIAIDPNYDNIQERHYYAYVNYGYWLLTQNRCTDSKQAFLSALNLRPDGEEAHMGLQLVAQYCATPIPPSPTPTPTQQVTAGPTGVATGTPSPGPTPTASEFFRASFCVSGGGAR